MKKKIVPFFLFFLIVTPVYAESSARVEVKNTVNSSSFNSVNTSKSTTHIRVETNGKVTEYNSDEPGDVEVNAVNDDSEIKVNGKEVLGTNSEENENVSPMTSASPTIKPESEHEEITEDSMIEKILNKLNEIEKKLFEVFH